LADKAEKERLRLEDLRLKQEKMSAEAQARRDRVEKAKIDKLNEKRKTAEEMREENEYYMQVRKEEKDFDIE
jgi:hypothetical protein